MERQREVIADYGGLTVRKECMKEWYQSIYNINKNIQKALEVRLSDRYGVKCED